MFENTLLDSSSSRIQVLSGIHYGISLALGIAAFFAAKTIWPQLTMAEESTILIAAGVMGGLIFVYALMICFVFSGSRKLGLSTVFWVPFAMVFNVLGYLFYTYFSAKKTGDWKLFTIPMAVIGEVPQIVEPDVHLSSRQGALEQPVLQDAPEEFRKDCDHVEYHVPVAAASSPPFSEPKSDDEDLAATVSRSIPAGHRAGR